MAENNSTGKLGDDSEFLRLLGVMPHLKPIEKRRFRAKLFKSGNSLAVRIPAGTRLSPGMEMDMVIEDGQFVSIEPVDQPKRKFNVAKVAGSAKSLNYVEPGTRVFEARPSEAKSAKSDT
jgi:antitoxin VapB